MSITPVWDECVEKLTSLNTFINLNLPKMIAEAKNEEVILDLYPLTEVSDRLSVLLWELENAQ